MNINDLRPANEMARRFGVKSLIYGGPGTGKTPLVQTCPRPVMLVIEPGMLSMRTSTIPCFEAPTPERIDDFFAWIFKSHEAKSFDTLAVDSVSQMAEVFLSRELGKWKDGRKAYGEMSRHVMDGIVNPLYYLPQKHIYLIAKQGTVEEGGSTKRRPYFPGQDLNIKVPHLFDEVWHLGMQNIPGVAGAQLAIRTRDTFDTMARDRSGMLNELEPPNIGALFSKAMS